MKTKRTIKSVLKAGLYLSLVLLFFSSCVEDFGSDYRGNDYVASEDFDYAFDVTGPGDFVVDAINGNVEVIGVSGSQEIIVYGERRVESNSLRDARWFLDQVQVQIIIENQRLTVLTDQPHDVDGRNVIVDYFVRLPRDWFVDIENNNGNIAVSQINQTVIIDVDNGQIDAAAINGNISTDLTNGNIYLNDVRGNVNADLVNGNIVADLSLLPGGTCDLDAVNGQVFLTIPTGTSAQLNAKVTNGGISSIGLPLQDSQSTPTSLRGRLGSGNGTINLEAVNGNISIEGE